MITYVLTISEYFPKTHKRSGDRTEFPLSIKHYDKTHTIRGNYELWRKRFEKINKGEAILSVRIWERKPYRSNQMEIFKYDITHKIGIEILEFRKDRDSVPRISYPIIENYAEPDIELIAKNDGLSLPDFKEWFKSYDLSKPMAIIHFTDFRYCPQNQKA